MKFRAGPRIALVPSAGFQVVGLKQFPGGPFRGVFNTIFPVENQLSRQGESETARLMDVMIFRRFKKGTEQAH